MPLLNCGDAAASLLIPVLSWPSALVPWPSALWIWLRPLVNCCRAETAPGRATLEACANWATWAFSVATCVLRFCRLEAEPATFCKEPASDLSALPAVCRFWATLCSWLASALVWLLVWEAIWLWMPLRICCIAPSITAFCWSFRLAWLSAALNWVMTESRLAELEEPADPWMLFKVLPACSSWLPMIWAWLATFCRLDWMPVVSIEVPALCRALFSCWIPLLICGRPLSSCWSCEALAPVNWELSCWLIWFMPLTSCWLPALSWFKPLVIWLPPELSWAKPEVSWLAPLAAELIPLFSWLVPVAAELRPFVICWLPALSLPSPLRAVETPLLTVFIWLLT